MHDMRQILRVVFHLTLGRTVVEVMHSSVACAAHPGIRLHYHRPSAAQLRRSEPQGVGAGIGACVCGWRRGQRDASTGAEELRELYGVEA
jgi:hypothetical protein